MWGIPSEQLTCAPILDQLDVGNFPKVRTDCKPRANNRLFGVKKGFPVVAVAGGTPFVVGEVSGGKVTHW
jgi:hypothetical protein